MEITDLTAALEARIDVLEAELAESLGMLELALEDDGWRRLSAVSQQEFSREGLLRVAELCRLMRLKNPLIRRACAVQRNYVFGQGVTATATAEQVNAVLKAFWADPKNQAALTGHQAMQQRDTDLMTDGNLFLALFTNPRTGRVRVRCLPVEEVHEIVADPDDAATPRFYLRAWTSADTGQRNQVAYPDWRYTPRARPAEVRGGYRVQWDAPVMHVAPERVGRWGVPELYAAIDWARAYREFLEDWATFTRALSRFAAKLTTTGGKKGVQAARAKLASTLGTGAAPMGETNPPPVAGSVFVGAEGVGYEPVRIGGANVSMDDGRRLLLMVAAAVGLPETFFGDASVGTLATAKSLDRPTELAMQNRQRLHQDVLIDILEYVVRKAAAAPQGPLRPLARSVSRVYDPDDGTVTETIVWADVLPPPRPGVRRRREPLDASVTVSFPPVVAMDTSERMDAVERAEGLLPPGPTRAELVARLALEALGVAEVDSVLDAMRDDLEGNAMGQDAGGGADAPAAGQGGERPILGYHIEQGVVSRNEARANLGLPPEDDTQSEQLRRLREILAVTELAKAAGLDARTAARLTGLDDLVTAAGGTVAPPPPPPAPAGGASANAATPADPATEGPPDAADNAAAANP